MVSAIVHFQVLTFYQPDADSLLNFSFTMLAVRLGSEGQNVLGGGEFSSLTFTGATCYNYYVYFICCTGFTVHQVRTEQHFGQFVNRQSLVCGSSSLNDNIPLEN